MSFFPKSAVVAPCDFSNESFNAVRTAMGLVASPADVHVVHVLYDDAPVATPGVIPGVVWGEIDVATRVAEATSALNASLRSHRCEGVSAIVKLGDAGFEIAELADEVKAELIVMPSHGRSGINRLLMGSVAERVLRLAHCPVLVMRSARAAA